VAPTSLRNTSSAANRTPSMWTTVPGVETGAVSVDRPAVAVLVDDDLATAFMRWRSRSNRATRCISASRCMSRRTASAYNGADASSSRTAATSRIGIGCCYWLSAESRSSMVSESKQYGLARRPAVPSLDDAEALRIRVAATRSPSSDVGTSGVRSRFAPGALRRTLTEAEATRTPYVTMYPPTISTPCFRQLRVPRRQWTPATGSGRPVAIQIFHHPGHTGNLPHGGECTRLPSITTRGSFGLSHTAVSG